MGSMCLLHGLRHLGSLGQCSRGMGGGRDGRRGCRRWCGLGLHLAPFFWVRGWGHSTIQRGFSHDSISNLGRRGTRSGWDDNWGVKNPNGFRGRKGKGFSKVANSSQGKLSLCKDARPHILLQLQLERE